jgi:hypothetical protein
MRFTERTVSRHTRKLSAASKRATRLNCEGHSARPLYSHCFAQLHTPVLCQLQLRERPSYKANGRLYTFLEGTRTWMGYGIVQVSRGKRAAGMWSPCPTGTVHATTLFEVSLFHCSNILNVHVGYTRLTVVENSMLICLIITLFAAMSFLIHSRDPAFNLERSSFIARRKTDACVFLW